MGATGSPWSLGEPPVRHNPPPPAIVVGRARRAEQSPSSTIGTRFVVEVRACRGACRIDHWRDADGDLHERAPDHLEGGSSRREHFGAARSSQ
jgi:hypothetical protein